MLRRFVPDVYRCPRKYSMGCCLLMFAYVALEHAARPGWQAIVLLLSLSSIDDLLMLY